MQHHKPECHAEKLVHCLQCQGHREGWYNQNMTISAISSKLLIHLQSNWVWYYSILSWSVLWKKWIAAFKVKVTAKIKMSVNVCWYDIFWTTEHFVIQPGVVMQHHKPECHAEKSVQYQGHSEGLYNQNMTISAVSSKLLVGLQPNFVW